MQLFRQTLCSLVLALAFASFVQAEECYSKPVLRSFFEESAPPTSKIIYSPYWKQDGHDISKMINIANVTHLPLKLLGSGIRSFKTNESMTFACIAVSDDGLDVDCSCVRPVYHNPQTNQTYAFGHTFKIVEGDSLRKTMREAIAAHTQQDENHTYHNRFLAPALHGSQPLSSTSGWNWSTSPDGVFDHRFRKILNSLGGGWIDNSQKR